MVRGKGVLVTPGDAASFSNAIVRLAENPEEREKLGRAAREFAIKELDRKKILSKFTNHLNSFQKNKFRQD